MPALRGQELGPACNSILRNRGAVYESIVFAALKQHPHVVRSFEFALADGGVFCASRSFSSTLTRSSPLSYADRFFELLHDQLPHLSEHVLFDIKSTTGYNANEQGFITSRAQLRHVAFYISICAADTSFVMLIPNLQQSDTTETIYARQECDDEEVSILTARASWIQPSAYGIDPSYAPYAMPISLLPEAISSVRECVLTGNPYTNPWTKLDFPNWIPRPRSRQFLTPLEATQHYTSLLAIREIQHALKPAMLIYKGSFDFLWLQPRLADFKIIMLGRQYLVQHKIDSHSYSTFSRLSTVEIGRSCKDGTRWYFTEHERFDFFMYEFTFNAFPQPRRELFFIPEFAFPDDFYTTSTVQQDFERPEFQQYRLRKDDQGKWAESILHIIQSHPKPRRSGQRPTRVDSPSVLEGPELVKSNISDSNNVQDSLQVKLHGRRDYNRAMTNGHRHIFHGLMTQCALRGSGLLVVLGREHPLGDFAFLRYTWTQDEKRDFQSRGRVPKYLYHLPPDTPIVPFYCFVYDAECTMYGPPVYSPVFRRINFLYENRLIVWSLFGSSEEGRSYPLVVIPSEDLRPTVKQRQRYTETLAKRKNREFPGRDPKVSEMLSTGLYAADYTIGAQGPSTYGTSDCVKLWDLLYKFTLQTWYMIHCLRNACSVNCGISVSVDNPGCLQESNRHSIGFHDTNVQQVSLVFSPDSGCSCQNECLNDILIGDNPAYEPPDCLDLNGNMDAQSFRFIGSECGPDNC